MSSAPCKAASIAVTLAARSAGALSQQQQGVLEHCHLAARFVTLANSSTA